MLTPSPAATQGPAGPEGHEEQRGNLHSLRDSTNQQKVALACLECTFVSEETRGQRNIDEMQEKRMTRNKKNESGSEQ